MSSLIGRVALVTGAGRGLGRAHALALSRAGAAVVVNDVGRGVDGSGDAEDVGAATAAELVAEGGTAVADTSDISTFEGAQAAVSAALDAFGRIDILVNNAGITGGGRLHGTDTRLIERIFAVHVTGTLGTIRAALPRMLENGWGRIVNTVSEAALTAAPGGGVAYGAAKAAVWSATLSLARDCEGTGVTVNGLSPGARTRMSAAAIDAGYSSRALDLDPSHVARVVAYLSSERAADINGRVVHVAGVHIREYSNVRRSRDTELVARLERELGSGASPQW